MTVILIVILILIVINGFFAASEMALVSIKPQELHKIVSNGSRNSNYLVKVLKDSTRYLSTIQVAITFAGFLSSAFAGSEIAGEALIWLNSKDILVSENIVVIGITVILSFITLVFGELVPKRLAMAKPKQMALLCAPFIYYAMKLFNPFVKLLSMTTNAIVRMFSIKVDNENIQVSEKEIKELIVYGHVKGLYQTEEKKMLERIFTLDDITTSMVMTPISEVIGFDLSNINEEMYHKIIQSKYTRIPLYEGELQNIKGVVHVKDILLELDTNTLFELDLLSLVRSPMYVDNHVSINKLLVEMKKTREHLAFVMEDKEIIGIVTLEDIIEEITGNIYDEHDSLKEDYEYTYIVPGDITMREISEKTGNLKLDNDLKLKDYIVDKLGYIPSIEDGEIELIPSVKIEVINTNANEITRVKLILEEQ